MKKTTWVLLLSLGIGCTSVDPAFYTRDGIPLADVDRLPYRIAFAAFPAGNPLDGKRKEKEDYWFFWGDKEVQQRIVAVMDPDPAKAGALHLDDLLIRTQNAANEIIAVPASRPETALEHALRQEADLLVMPRVAEPAAFRFHGNRRKLISTLLWFFTWVGGLHVQDKTYDASIAFDFDILNPYDGTTLATYTATSDKMDLTLWERNRRAFHKEIGRSVLLPPHMAHDNKARVSKVLSDLVCARIAARLTGYLKQDFVDQAHALIGRLRAVQPKNGTEVGPELRLVAEVIADRPVTGLAVYLNGEEIDRRDETTPEIADPETHQASGTIYRLPIRIRHKLIPKRNVVRIEYAVQGRTTSRTLIYTNDEPPKPEPESPERPDERD